MLTQNTLRLSMLAPRWHWKSSKLLLPAASTDPFYILENQIIATTISTSLATLPSDCVGKSGFIERPYDSAHTCVTSCFLAHPLSETAHSESDHTQSSNEAGISQRQKQNQCASSPHIQPSPFPESIALTRSQGWCTSRWTMSRVKTR